jgi:hypothetical protein
MSEDRVKKAFFSFLRYLAVGASASIINASCIFVVFLNLAIRAQMSLRSTDFILLWLLPFLTCVFAGGAMGNVKDAVKDSVLIIFLSIAIAIWLASLPVITGMISSVALGNSFLMGVISTNFYVFFLMVWAIFPGVIIGASLVGR